MRANSSACCLPRPARCLTCLLFITNHLQLHRGAARGAAISKGCAPRPHWYPSNLWSDRGSSVRQYGHTINRQYSHHHSCGGQGQQKWHSGITHQGWPPSQGQQRWVHRAQGRRGVRSDQIGSDQIASRSGQIRLRSLWGHSFSKWCRAGAGCVGGRDVGSVTQQPQTQMHALRGCEWLHQSSVWAS